MERERAKGSRARALRKTSAGTQPSEERSGRANAAKALSEEDKKTLPEKQKCKCRDLTAKPTGRRVEKGDQRQIVQRKSVKKGGSDEGQVASTPLWVCVR